MDRVGLTGPGHGAGGLDGAEISPGQLLFVKIERLPGGGVGDHRLVPGGAGVESLHIHRVLPLGAGDGGVDIVQIDIGPVAEGIVDGHILLAEGIVRIGTKVPAPLAGQIGDHIGTAGGDADQVIKGLDIPVQQKIVNAGGEGASHPAAYVNDA
jgi:hypothetical protein